MTRDWLLGFPPVLLAQDAPVRQQFVTPPRPPACVDARSGAVIDKAETAALGKPAGQQRSKQEAPDAEAAAFDKWLAKECPSGDTTSVHEQWLRSEARAEFIDATTPPGVWRKTAEHKPPVGSEHLTRYTGRGCERAPDVRRLVWNGKVWREGAVNVGSEITRDWLDTSGEFKVGDRVRVKDGVESIYCKPGMIGVVAPSRSGSDVWFRADGEDSDFCTTDWLEHA